MGKRGGNKRLRAREHNKGKKLGVSANPETVDYNSLSPAFNFEYLEKNYCISDCDKDQKAALLDSFHSRCLMTWREIINAPRHGLGTEKISSSSIHPPIPARFSDQDFFLAFRAIGMAPALGVRRGRTFFVVWIDRDYKAYDH